MAKRIISVEGYKAFFGTMKIIPKDPKYLPYEIFGEWLYKPDTDCWYCRGQSYSAKCCHIEEIL